MTTATASPSSVTASSTPPSILAISGSLRKDSWNTRLVRIAAAGAQSAGAIVTLAELRDFPMPLFSEELERESGMPEQAKRFRDLLMSHQALLIASPEYNSSLTAALKNAIDWASRGHPSDPPGTPGLAAFGGKLAALMSTSTGALGGLRGLVHLRAILSNIRVMVVPDQVAIPKAMEAFTPEGRLKDDKQQASVEQLGRTLVNLTRKIR